MIQNIVDDHYGELGDCYKALAFGVGEKPDPLVVTWRDTEVWCCGRDVRVTVASRDVAPVIVYNPWTPQAVLRSLPAQCPRCGTKMTASWRRRPLKRGELDRWPGRD